jgi:galactokinase
MTGGGFGGCTINLVRADESGEFRRRMSEEYQTVTGLKPAIYICQASQGAQIVVPEDSLERPRSTTNL